MTPKKFVQLIKEQETLKQQILEHAIKALELQERLENVWISSNLI